MVQGRGSKKIRVIKLVSIFILLPLSIGVAVWNAEESGFFNLTSVSLVLKNSPNNPYYYGPLASKLHKKLNSMVGRSLWRIDVKDIMALTSKEPWIKRVQLSREWPDNLVVEVEPEIVRAIYADGGPRLTPVSDGGKLLNAIDSSVAPDVVVLKGPIFEKREDLRARAVELLQELPADGSFSQKTISEMRYDEKNGFWVSMIRTGLSVRLGEAGIKDKAKRVSQVLDYMENKNIQGRVIDADFSKKVLVKLRKEP